MYFDKRKSILGLNIDQLDELIGNKRFNSMVDHFIKEIDEEEDIEETIDEMSHYLYHCCEDLKRGCLSDSDEDF